MAGGFVYLVAVMDWYSRYVLSWALSVTAHSDDADQSFRSHADQIGA
jgi:putative transposase